MPHCHLVRSSLIHGLWKKCPQPKMMTRTKLSLLLLGLIGGSHGGRINPRENRVATRPAAENMTVLSSRLSFLASGSSLADDAGMNDYVMPTRTVYTTQFGAQFDYKHMEYNPDGSWRETDQGMKSNDQTYGPWWDSCPRGEFVKKICAIAFPNTHVADVVSVAGIGLAWSTIDPESEHTRFEVIAPSSNWINKAGAFFYNSHKFWEWDENSATGLGLDWFEWSNLDTTLFDLLTTDPKEKKFLDAKYQNRYCMSLDVSHNERITSMTVRASQLLDGFSITTNKPQTFSFGGPGGSQQITYQSSNSGDAPEDLRVGSGFLCGLQATTTGLNDDVILSRNDASNSITSFRPLFLRQITGGMLVDMITQADAYLGAGVGTSPTTRSSTVVSQDCLEPLSKLFTEEFTVTTGQSSSFTVSDSQTLGFKASSKTTFGMSEKSATEIAEKISAEGGIEGIAEVTEDTSLKETVEVATSTSLETSTETSSSSTTGTQSVKSDTQTKGERKTFQLECPSVGFGGFTKADFDSGLRCKWSISYMSTVQWSGSTWTGITRFSLHGSNKTVDIPASGYGEGEIHDDRINIFLVNCSRRDGSVAAGPPPLAASPLPLSPTAVPPPQPGPNPILSSPAVASSPPPSPSLLSPPTSCQSSARAACAGQLNNRLVADLCDPTCNRYFSCANNDGTKLACPALTPIFNENNQQCDWPSANIGRMCTYLSA